MPGDLIRFVFGILLLIIGFDFCMSKIGVKFRLHKWILNKLKKLAVPILSKLKRLAFWILKLPIRGTKAGAKKGWRAFIDKIKKKKKEDPK